MRTPTLNCAGKLPSLYASQAGCIAGEQIFDDCCSLRPSSRCKVASAEITLIQSVLKYESEVRASARGALLPIPGVDSPLLSPPERPA